MKKVQDGAADDVLLSLDIESIWSLFASWRDKVPPCESLQHSTQLSLLQAGQRESLVPLLDFSTCITSSTFPLMSGDMMP